MDEWKRIWATHGLEELPSPTDAPTWEELPSLTVHDLRQAIRYFSLVTPSGPTRIHPRRPSTYRIRLSVGLPRCSRSLSCTCGFPQTA
eukprot:8113636-Pyramimonas_sp.AAC.1